MLLYGDRPHKSERFGTLFGMCRRVECGSCQKPGWKGCGAHVEAVLGDVAVEDRCACDGGASSGLGGGFLKRLFGG